VENREALEQQLRDLEAQKESLFGNGADQASIIRINEQINEVRQQLSAIETNEIAESYQTSDAPYIISVSGVDINLRDYIESDNNYRVIAIALSQKDRESLTNHQSAITDITNRFEIERQQYRDQITNADAAADERYNELSERNEATSFENARNNAELALLRTQHHDLKNERDDFERRLQAATNEIESLKQQLEIANSKVETPKQTNVDGSLAEAMRKANEAKRAIYDVQKDSANINYTAKFVDTNEEFSDKVVYIGKYRALSEEEASRFRAELEAAKSDIPEDTEPVSSDLEVTIPAPTFPTEVSDAHDTDGVAGNSTKTEVVQNHDGGTTGNQEPPQATLEERVTMLEMKYKGLAETVYGVRESEAA
jgi:chromosome segregation ATPase